jgi:hypothetical protein
MKKIALLQSGIDIAPMHKAIDAHPELWNQNPQRTANENSPHYGLSDIWARFCAPGVDGSMPHESMWYPCAEVLPIRELVYPLMAAYQGDQLGGVLITKIPAGKECKPHIDPGWHARHYKKFAIQIAASEGQQFCFESESLASKPGDLFYFDNSFNHWVTNPTVYDRITAIICIKTDMEF